MMTRERQFEVVIVALARNRGRSMFAGEVAMEVNGFALKPGEDRMSAQMAGARLRELTVSGHVFSSTRYQNERNQRVTCWTIR